MTRFKLNPNSFGFFSGLDFANETFLLEKLSSMSLAELFPDSIYPFFFFFFFFS